VKQRIYIDTSIVGGFFDCLEMKSNIQAEIYTEIKDMNASERIAYYKKGTKEFLGKSLNIYRQER